MLIPCWLLGKLARDISAKGQGVGTALLRDALQRVKTLSAEGGGYCVVVDSKDEKSDLFYKQYGFELLDESKNEHRFYLPVAEIP
ncbi:hypothetical protein RsTz2092_00580 [Deferribacterales bacterium RsTz2092]|nr:hypothetical protein AGMMS49941_01130 [Deferribacterales bacterium]